MDPLIINVCLTGAVSTKQENPHLPVTQEEIIEDAHRVLSSGASMLHIHGREPDGTPTWRPERVAPVFEAIRKEHPHAILVATTTGRVFPDFEHRASVLELDGQAKPDMASLTLGSMNFPKSASVNSPQTIERLAGVMTDRGIRPELEIFETGMLHYARYLMRKGVLPTFCYANFLLGSLGTAPARMLDLALLVRDLPEGWVWAGAGIGRYQLSMNGAAVVMGGHVRVGLEDNLFFDPQKQILATNPMLVERVVRMAEAFGRRIATQAEARAVLKLNAPPFSL